MTRKGSDRNRNPAPKPSQNPDRDPSAGRKARWVQAVESWRDDEMATDSGHVLRGRSASWRQSDPAFERDCQTLDRAADRLVAAAVRDDALRGDPAARRLLCRVYRPESANHDTEGGADPGPEPVPADAVPSEASPTAGEDLDIPDDLGPAVFTEEQFARWGATVKAVSDQPSDPEPAVRAGPA